MLDHADSGTNDRRWSIATEAYELHPQHVRVGLQGVRLLRRISIRKSIAKEGNVGRLCVAREC